jgi:hypothetical protein
VEVSQLGYRFFTFPGNGADEWNPEVHGVEITGNENYYTEVFAELAWIPGQYEFNYGASGNSFVLSVPEPNSAINPSQKIMQGFHEFLKVAYDV